MATSVLFIEITLGEYLLVKFQFVESFTCALNRFSYLHLSTIILLFRKKEGTFVYQKFLLFYPSRRLGISSRFSVYIIAVGVYHRRKAYIIAVGVYHRRRRISSP